MVALRAWAARAACGRRFRLHGRRRRGALETMLRTQCADDGGQQGVALCAHHGSYQIADPRRCSKRHTRRMLSYCGLQEICRSHTVYSSPPGRGTLEAERSPQPRKLGRVSCLAAEASHAAEGGVAHVVERHSSRLTPGWETRQSPPQPTFSVWAWIASATVLPG